MYKKANTIMLAACLLAFFMAVGADARASVSEQQATTADSLTSKGKYVDGKKHGIWKSYTASGLLYKKEKYRHGELLYYIIYNEKHKAVETRDRKGRVRYFKPCNC